MRGVGNGGEKCTHNCVLPVTLLSAEGRHVTGTFYIPTLPGSQLLPWFRLSAARESRMIIDTTRNATCMAGLGVYDPMQALPPGAQQFNCASAPSGRLLIPCAEFPAPTEQGSRGRLRLTPELALPVEVTHDTVPTAEVPQMS